MITFVEMTTKKISDVLNTNLKVMCHRISLFLTVDMWK